MKNVFTVKGLITPEEYLKNLLDCIGENGELCIAPEMIFQNEKCLFADSIIEASKADKVSTIDKSEGHHKMQVKDEQLAREIKNCMVGHIVPIKQGGSKFDSENLQSLCRACHSRKSAEEGSRWKRKTRDY